VLRDQRGGAYRSEVSGAQDGVLFLAPPADLPAGAFPPGTRLLVAWPDETSLRVLPVLLLNVTADGRLAVQIQGSAWREERRRYARTKFDATLCIGYDRADGQQVEASGELIDLSEAALRGLVAADHQPLRQRQTPVRVRIDMADDSFDIAGYVLQGKPTARADLGLEVVVLFHRPVPRLEELRRHLSGLVAGGG